MKFNTEYIGQVTSVKCAKKAIKGVEDQKVYKRVGLIKLEMPYTDGDLDSHVDSSISDDRSYDSCSWGERVGKYEIDINGIVSKAKIIKIQRSNKDDVEGKFSILFETEDLDNISTIGNYLKDKDNPATFKLTAINENEIAAKAD
jgi:hypothetical protein